MYLNELLVVSSTILLGGTFGHLALLSIAKQIRKARSCSFSIHGLSIVPEDHNCESHLSHQLSGTDDKAASHQVRSTSGLGGLITKLSTRSILSLEKPWSQSDRRVALHSAVVAAHEENPRSTYLGATTFDPSNPSAHLFGWHRIQGKPTIQLGEIAVLTRTSSDMGLRIMLHPEDAQKVIEAGWGTQISSKQRKGVQVSLKAPQSQAEVEDVTQKVIEAAIWFVAGLDEKEDV